MWSLDWFLRSCVQKEGRPQQPARNRSVARQPPYALSKDLISATQGRVRRSCTLKTHKNVRGFQYSVDVRREAPTPLSVVSKFQLGAL